MNFLKRRAEERRLAMMDPDAVERGREKSKLIARMMWFSAGCSIMSVLTSLGSGLVRIGSGLSVAAMLATTALVLMDESSDRSPPRWLRWSVYLFTVVAAVTLIAGLVRRFTA